MRVIFLDVDGVLNPHNYCEHARSSRIEHVFVQRLNAILRETGAKIVVSSAWRYLVIRDDMSLAGLDWLLRSHGVLADRVIGITRPDTMERARYDGDPSTWPTPNERGAQIVDYVREWNDRRDATPITEFLAIDDLDLGISEAGVPLLLTHGKTGLTDADVRVAIEMLGEAVEA